MGLDTIFEKLPDGQITPARRTATSALPPIADLRRQNWHVAKVPTTEVSSCKKGRIIEPSLLTAIASSSAAVELLGGSGKMPRGTQH